MSQLTQIQAVHTQSENANTPSVHWFGFWVSILIAIAPVAALLLAMNFAPPRSGPYCMVDLVGTCLEYPYVDAAAFVPVDYLWMYPAIFMGPLFVMLMACIHHYAPANRKAFTQIALSFAILAAGALIINYFIQLTVVQPSLLKGEIAGLMLLSQYNPHGLFIALEDLGYLMMGGTFLFAAPAFVRRQSLDRAIRLVFFVVSALTIGSYVILTLIYGFDLEYRYEVVSILIDWAALLIVGIMLSVFFRREAQRASV